MQEIPGQKAAATAAEWGGFGGSGGKGFGGTRLTHLGFESQKDTMYSGARIGWEGSKPVLSNDGGFGQQGFDLGYAAAAVADKEIWSESTVMLVPVPRWADLEDSDEDEVLVEQLGELAKDYEKILKLKAIRGLSINKESVHFARKVDLLKGRANALQLQS